jgi:hypothetical protein
MTSSSTIAPQQDRIAAPKGLPASALIVLGVVACGVCAVGVIGSDALWLSAMGDTIRHASAIPTGIPFAAAPSAEWVNTTVLGQLVFAAVTSASSLGLVVAQLLATVVTLAILATSAHRLGARPAAVALVTALTFVGAAAPLLIARAQLLSLVPFAVLLVLVRAEHRAPSRRIWWSIPLVALWGNLHGAVLAGVAVLGCYLVFSRLRVQPVTAVSVAGLSLLATCANPGLLKAPRYYAGVFGGAATSHETGMWNRPSLDNPLDVLLIGCAIVLLVLALRRRRPVWEYAAGLGLLIATATASRHGIWLLLFLFVPAATGLSPATRAPTKETTSRPTLSIAAVTLVAAVGILWVRAPGFAKADTTARDLVSQTRGQVVLATEPLSEALAAAGGKVWMSNPLDAFAHADQTAYLAFLSGDATGAERALGPADVVIAPQGSASLQLAAAHGFTETARVGSYVVLKRAA